MPLKFSVVIPVYNTEKYLRKCLDSLVSQDYDNFQVIVVDDASTDGSHGICLEYSERYPFVKLISQESNKGVGMARIAGVGLADGDYITFLDSDDYYEPHLFREMAQVLNERLYDVVQFKANIVNESGKIIGATPNNPGVFNKDYCLRQMLQRDGVSLFLWDKFYKKDVIKKSTVSEACILQDALTNISIFSACVDNYKCIPDVFYNYLKRKKSVSSGASKRGCMLTLNRIEEVYKTQSPDYREYTRMYLLITSAVFYGYVFFSKDKAMRIAELKTIKEKFKGYSAEPVPREIRRKFRLKERASVAVFSISPFIFSCLYRLLYMRI